MATPTASVANETDDLIFLETPTAQAISGVFAWLGMVITIYQIYQHLRYYSKPAQQRWIVRILFIVPIYGLCSWISLLLIAGDYYIYFESIRGCYEAFLIYNFLSLNYEYLGGEPAILDELNGKPARFSYWTLTCCLKNKSYSLPYFRFCKQATLQFCIIKPLMSILSVILYSLGVYHDGNLSPTEAYLYITVVYNISVTLALYGLLLFYMATRELLKPYHPVLKFIIIKSLLLFYFWQGVLLAVLEKTNVIKKSHSISAGVIASGYQDFLLCVEIFFLAVALFFAFPYNVYREDYQDEFNQAFRLRTVTTNLGETINPKDIFTDALHNFSPSYQNYVQYRSENGRSNKLSDHPKDKRNQNSDRVKLLGSDDEG
ncbi:Transmembrane protein 184B [Trichoplax sp. H2]|uniref:Transmembrane protein 184B n=1 Tax=Trichoplax adhaerens TaxID=10228 RepID=B3SDQ9_TRIAD|nr:hypothetical protein TRIADDRAFT_34097 [Trichoplax adhaerens]EDV19140.1 hypothetical protein TRIADDRAFT_34097 [Trichoplax adhaerens]RDD37945.1 Transmembrane protein 184B [Trichoplax sp. H2]|eukprot:XP_002118373.1 hypothetical protein TRIADDRAFT_34097 [Trichoplax adhaerens]